MALLAIFHLCRQKHLCCFRKLELPEKATNFCHRMVLRLNLETLGETGTDIINGCKSNDHIDHDIPYIFCIVFMKSG